MALKQTLSSLVPLLVEAVPQAIASLRLSSPTCIVRICYYDSHAPQTYLLLRTVSSTCRAEILASKGADRLDHLWASGDGEIIIPPENPESNADKKLAMLFAQVYACMCDDEDEKATMVLFGQMLCKVAKKLNASDWKTVCPTTDDFVIFPADESMEFRAYAEDFADSVPLDRQELLSVRGTIRNWWLNFDPKAAMAALEAEQAAGLMAYQLEAEAKLRPIFLEAERAQQEKLKRGEACPKCGFAFKWNGVECSHCSYRGK